MGDRLIVTLILSEAKGEEFSNSPVNPANLTMKDGIIRKT